MSNKDTAAFATTQHPIKTNLDETALRTPVTLLRGTNPAPTDYSTLGEVFARMRDTDPAKREKALVLRQLAYKVKIEGDETAYKEQKETLPGFLVGRWTRRSDAPENCTQYAPFLVLDFDYSCFYEPDAPPFTNEVCQEVFLKICSDPHTFAAFMSPSGGLRVMVRTKSNYHSHRETYARLMAQYSRTTGLPILESKKKEGRKITNAPFGIDSTCRNESRFFYFVEGLTADEFYLNENSREFATETALKSSKGEKAPTTLPTEPQAVKQLTDAECWEIYEMMTDERHSPTAEAGRNGRLLFLAQLAHDHGESEGDILDYCLQYVEPDFNKSEITSTVKSAVKRTNCSKFDRKNLVNYKAKREKEANKKMPNTAKKTKGDGEQLPYNRMVAYLQKHYEFQLDVVGNELEYRPKGSKSWQVLNENNLLHELRAKGHKITDSLLMSLLGSDFVPRFDPFLTYFKSLPAHDPAKGSPIDRMAAFVTLNDETKDRDWFNRMYRKMLVRVAAAAVGRIPFNKQCFVLKSDQNDGKSTLIRHHCPPLLAKYRADWTRDEVSDKDGRFALAQNFLINLDELATFGKVNIEQTKALMSLDSIKERPPYGKRPIRFPRRASFFGSTNKDEFLTDESGSVRWLVFEIAGIKHDNGGANGYGAQVDINALWAEAWHLLNTGEIDPMLTRDEIAESEARNKAFQVPTQEMEMVRQFLSKTNKDEIGAEFLSTTAITNYLCGFTNLRLNKNYVGAALKYYGWKKVKAYNRAKKYQDDGYWVKKEATHQSDFE